jgi:anti-sigma regulatory factor (Ser/Thr protein kinase)
MPVGTARTSTAIKVTIARDPALVRTVRLVAAAVARRTGQDEEFVEDIRLAIGEACALMIGETAAAPSNTSGPVEVTMAIADRFRVEVASKGGIAVEDDDSDADGVQPWSLLRGLIEDFAVNREGPVSTFSMSWPLA